MTAPTPPSPHRRGGIGAGLLWSLLPLASFGALTFVPPLSREPRRSGRLAASAALSAAAVVGYFAPGGVGDYLLTVGWLGGVAFTVATIGRGSRGHDTNRLLVEQARDQAEQRRQARRLMAEQPSVAKELAIGRPDLNRGYDDGGLVDVNTAPPEVLAAVLGWTAPEAADVATVRERLGRLSGPGELIAYTSIPPASVDGVQDRLVFSG